IIITPNLVSIGRPAAGSLETEAELLVDRATNQNVTHIYVKGVDDVRYTSIVISLNGSVPWPPSGTAPSGFPNVSNWTDVIVAALVTPLNPVAVNVTAVYVDANNVTARYTGLYEFNVSSGMLYSEALAPAAGSIASTPLNDLPITFFLEIASVGGRT
ncbi:MAG TPA: hypothetical protein VLY85_03220, partial [Thermoplasmata archaeon]|nr:hypothetical protein [Thermoplasmata archaeon]